jgi:hypothetical protein
MAAESDGGKQAGGCCDHPEYVESHGTNLTRLQVGDFVIDFRPKDRRRSGSVSIGRTVVKAWFMEGASESLEALISVMGAEQNRVMQIGLADVRRTRVHFVGSVWKAGPSPSTEPALTFR